MKERKIDGKKGKTWIMRIFLALIIAGAVYYFKQNIFLSIGTFIGLFIIFLIYSYFKNLLGKSARIKKIESVFPDFLGLMSSNLRAGITIDKAMLLSAREEFSPLDKEILKTGKDIATGKNIEAALLDMSKRIGSEKIHRTILLIISGIKAGGNIAVLLEETATNIREKDFVEKRAASNVLMYIIFIFLAVSVFAPVLFSLSTILVEVMTKLLSGMPDAPVANLAFTMSKINISTDFVKYYCLIFILAMDILASLVLGLVSKGEEKEGLKYLIPMIILSMAAFFISRIFLTNFLAGLF